MFPAAAITKKEVAAYYKMVAPFMLKHISGRPLTLNRFHLGIKKPGFWQKAAQDYFPEYIKRVEVEEEDGGTKLYAVAENISTIIYLTNLNSITFHIWLSRENFIRKPDQIIWDLDPMDKDFEKVRKAAFILKDFLEEELELQTFVKTTGSRGLHITTPIIADLDYDEVKDFSKLVSEEMAKRHPRLLTTEIRKIKRGKKVFVDYLRNSYAHTAVAPFSLRAIENATVAAPVTWQEVGNQKLRPNSYTLKNMKRRLNSKADIWEGFFDKPNNLKTAIQLFKNIQEKPEE